MGSHNAREVTRRLGMVLRIVEKERVDGCRHILLEKCFMAFPVGRGPPGPANRQTTQELKRLREAEKSRRFLRLWLWGGESKQDV